MEKQGNWIAALGADLKVSQLMVEANEVLDLVEVTVVDRVSGRPSQVLFLDRVEAARLRSKLSTDIYRLEAAEDSARATTDHPPGSLGGP